MSRRNVFVGIPTRSPDVKVQMMASLVQSVYELGAADMAMTLFVWSGDPLISHARNVILATFLQKTDCTDLFFVDDDVSWADGAMVKMMKHPVDLVAGAYRHKKDEESYPINWLPGVNGIQEPDPETKLLQVRDVPFGFCRITRSCAQRMFDAAKDREYTHKSAPDVVCREVFGIEYAKEPGEEMGQYFGEDYVFCRKWRDLGEKVWLDPELALNHTGTKVYMGHCGEWLRGNPSEVKPGADDYRSMLMDVRKAIAEVKAA